jgi:RNA polymerase sigma factor (sigma-70 family)
VRHHRDCHRHLGTGDLVRAFVGGDARAIDELMRRHRHVPAGSARRLLRSRAEVEDVVQETWARFTTHAPTIRDPDRLASWLWVTAANEARRLRRHAARQYLVEGFDDHPSEDAEEPVDTPERREALAHAVSARLSDRERELWALLVDARGLDYREISSACLRPVGAIGPTRARIIRKLQSHPDVARLTGAAA